jgi:hypothetical protein
MDACRGSLGAEWVQQEHAVHSSIDRSETQTKLLLIPGFPRHVACRAGPQMKIRAKPSTYCPPLTIKALSAKLQLILSEDLVDPLVERDARRTLAAARKWGFKFSDHDLTDPDCLSCLDLSLMDAAQAISSAKSSN